MRKHTDIHSTDGNATLSLIIARMCLPYYFIYSVQIHRYNKYIAQMEMQTHST